jgi:hypothetical protein
MVPTGVSPPTMAEGQTRMTINPPAGYAGGVSHPPQSAMVAYGAGHLQQQHQYVSPSSTPQPSGGSMLGTPGTVMTHSNSSNTALHQSLSTPGAGSHPNSSVLNGMGHLAGGTLSGQRSPPAAVSELDEGLFMAKVRHLLYESTGNAAWLPEMPDQSYGQQVYGGMQGMSSGAPVAAFVSPAAMQPTLMPQHGGQASAGGYSVPALVPNGLPDGLLSSGAVSQNVQEGHNGAPSV